MNMNMKKKEEFYSRIAWSKGCLKAKDSYRLRFYIKL